MHRIVFTSDITGTAKTALLHRIHNSFLIYVDMWLMNLLRVFASSRSHRMIGSRRIE